MNLPPSIVPIEVDCQPLSGKSGRGDFKWAAGAAPGFQRGGAAPPSRGHLNRHFVGDPMFKYLALPKPVLQKWRIWLKGQFIGDVPPEDAFCEFECDKTQCQFGHWETCERRVAYLELGKAQSGDASALKNPK
jgi:hypothetical protein